MVFCIRLFDDLRILALQVYQDMTQPLAHYFIFTGHNSYLTGNQLSSDSSVEPIKTALLRGVRVVELDLWPDDRGGVKVTHGKYVLSLLTRITKNSIYNINNHCHIPLFIGIILSYNVNRSSLF